MTSVGGHESQARWRRRDWLCTSLGSLASLHAAAAASVPVIEVASGATPALFTPEFFGMHIHRALEDGHWPSVAFGAWRLWDTRTLWLHLEPAAGQWKFDVLDRLVAQGTKAGVRMMLTLGITPRWASVRPDEPCAYGPGGAAPPRDVALWRTYVRQVARRYAGKLREYEVLNEANLTGYWSGTVAELAELVAIAAEEIRVVDPGATIVAPSGVGLDGRVGWIRNVLSAGIGSSVDALSFHLYHGGGPPESMVAPAVKMLQYRREAGHAGKPLWNTETGYWITPEPGVTVNFDEQGKRGAISPELAAARVPRAMLLARALGFERFYWYAWDSAAMGFIVPETNALRAHAVVLGAFIERFRGAQIGRVGRDATGLWTAALTMPSGAQALALWAESDAMVTTPRSSSRMPRILRFTGAGVEESTPEAGSALKVGQAVTLLVYDRA